MRCHFGRLWYAGPNAAANAVDYAKHYSRSHDAVIRVYEVRPRNDKRGVDLISDVLPFGRLWYGEPDHRYISLSQIKGRMSQKNCPYSSAFERARYVRGLSSYTSLFPMRR
jgi:hypothetical protein